MMKPWLLLPLTQLELSAPEDQAPNESPCAPEGKQRPVPCTRKATVAQPSVSLLGYFAVTSAAMRRLRARHASESFAGHTICWEP